MFQNFFLHIFRLNGVPSCIDRNVLTDILRHEWDFQGYIISDETAMTNIFTKHKFLPNNVTTAAYAILSGMNLEYKGDEKEAVFESLPKAVEAGYISSEEIRKTAKPLFYTRMRLGLFDPLYMNPYNNITMNMIQNKAYRDKAIKAAMQSFVLLKNFYNVLPLKKNISNLAVSLRFRIKMNQSFLSKFVAYFRIIHIRLSKYNRVVRFVGKNLD